MRLREKATKDSGSWMVWSWKQGRAWGACSTHGTARMCPCGEHLDLLDEYTDEVDAYRHEVFSFRTACATVTEEFRDSLSWPAPFWHSCRPTRRKSCLRRHHEPCGAWETTQTDLQQWERHQGMAQPAQCDGCDKRMQ